MKKFISIIMLVCIMASVCTVSAWAAPGQIALSGAWITYNGAREAYVIDIAADVTGNVAESELIIYLLYNGTTISETVPLVGVADSDLKEWPIKSTTCNIVANGKTSGSWSTTWFTPLSSTVKPDSYKIIADGSEYTGLIESEKGDGTSSFTCINKPFAVLGKGFANYYDTFEDAIANAPDGSDVFIRTANTYKLPDTSGRRIVLNGTVEGVIVDMEFKEAVNYAFGDKINLINLPVAPKPNEPAPDNNPSPVAPAAPVVENVYYIPATDDNSNMALWSILALALLTTAFVTRKRKTEN